MKKAMSLLLAVLLLALAGCGNAKKASTAEAETDSGVQAENAQKEKISESTAVSEKQEDTETQAASFGENTSGILVIFFSRTGEQYNVGVIDKGNTATVAEMIAEETGAEAFEVLPEEDYYPYTYDELTDVAKKEQNEKARPAYRGELPDLSSYETIFIGAPVWWGDWPMIMYTVFENNDFSGKTLIPFSTHEGSGLSGFDKKLQNACPDAEVLKGLAIRGQDAQNRKEKTRESVQKWLKDLGF